MEYVIMGVAMVAALAAMIAALKVGWRRALGGYLLAAMLVPIATTISLSVKSQGDLTYWLFMGAYCLVVDAILLLAALYLFRSAKRIQESITEGEGQVVSVEKDGLVAAHDYFITVRFRDAQGQEREAGRLYGFSSQGPDCRPGDWVKFTYRIKKTFTKKEKALLLRYLGVTRKD